MINSIYNKTIKVCLMQFFMYLYIGAACSDDSFFSVKPTPTPQFFIKQTPTPGYVWASKFTTTPILIANQPPPDTPTPKDTDGEGIMDPNDPDMDGDGVYNWNDDDIDGDGQKNDTDTDDDGDTIPDSSDSTPGGYGTDQSHYPGSWGGGCGTCNTPTSTSIPVATATSTPTSTPISNINVHLDPFYYYKTCEGNTSDIANEPLIITNGDSIQYRFRIAISPTNLTGVKVAKVKVSILNGANVVTYSERTPTGTYYPYWNIIAAGAPNTDNLSPLSLSGLTNNYAYQFSVDVDIDDNGTIRSFPNVIRKACVTDFNAVEVARTISGEDNISNFSRISVADSLWARWNFPEIPDGREFKRSTLIRSHTSMYNFATDHAIYHGNSSILLALQHSRVLGKTLLTFPNMSNGNGGIYFYQVGTSGTIPTLCVDSANVGITRKLAAFGNNYYGPNSNCQSWDTSFLQTRYNANPSDSLVW